MNYEVILLRLLHIIFGVFWAGSAIFIAFILQPRLKILGPNIQSQVMRALLPVMGPALVTSAIVTIIAGTALALRLQWGNLGSFLNTGWGLAMLLGLLTSIGAITSGITMLLLTRKLLGLKTTIGERTPTDKETDQLQYLSKRLPRLARSTAIMVIIALFTMATARFV